MWLQVRIAPDWLARAIDPSAPLVWLDTAGLPEAHDTREHTSYCNTCEAVVCARIASQLAELGLHADAIGVTSPYSRQVARIARELSECSAAHFANTAAAVMTIDKFQGQDRAAMIVSLVRSNAEGAAGALLADFRRVNVALTRAKTKLILVGDSATVSAVPVMREAFAAVRDLGVVVLLAS